jgi:hypothetical protein
MLEKAILGLPATMREAIDAFGDRINSAKRGEKFEKLRGGEVDRGEEVVGWVVVFALKRGRSFGWIH